MLYHNRTLGIKLAFWAKLVEVILKMRVLCPVWNYSQFKINAICPGNPFYDFCHGSSGIKSFKILFLPLFALYITIFVVWMLSTGLKCTTDNLKMKRFSVTEYHSTFTEKELKRRRSTNIVFNFVFSQSTTYNAFSHTQSHALIKTRTTLFCVSLHNGLK